jgi:hypothetical protein
MSRAIEPLLALDEAVEEEDLELLVECEEFVFALLASALPSSDSVSLSNLLDPSTFSAVSCVRI